MNDATKPCRRCLLSDLGDHPSREAVLKGISAIRDKDRADEKVYHDRLKICRSCDNLLSGTCLSCGCYVEIRAAVISGRCPMKKW